MSTDIINTKELMKEAKKDLGKKPHNIKAGMEISFPSDNSTENSGVFGTVLYYTEDSITIKMHKKRTLRKNALGMSLFINEIEFIVVQVGNIIRLKRK